MKIFTLFALILCLGISNGFGKVYPGLKVLGDFRKIQLLVEDVTPNKLVTYKEIVNTAKLKLFANNIKANAFDSEYVYLNVNVMPLDDGVNFVFYVGLALKKSSSTYGVSKTVAGVVFKPNQGQYGYVGICSDKSSLLDAIKLRIDKFLVDYIESNMED
jgi:hypothetical protein